MLVLVGWCYGLLLLAVVIGYCSWLLLFVMGVGDLCPLVCRRLFVFGCCLFLYVVLLPLLV